MNAMNKTEYKVLAFFIVFMLSTAFAQAQETKELKQVEITAAKRVVKQEADRIIYDLQADPDSKGSNLLDMMRKIPFLSVDGDDNLLLKGQAEYRVFINGRPSGMMEVNLKDVLRSMPASTIQKIEVITNPSSKYDAEGLAGIINIITIKNGNNGYNGTLNLAERFPVGGPALGGSFNYKQQKLGISAFGGASQYDRPLTQNILKRISETADRTVLLQNGASNAENRSGYFGSELSYEFDTLNFLSGQINVNGGRNEFQRSQHSVLNADVNSIENYLLQNHNLTNNNSWDASLNYQRGFKRNKNQLFTFSYRYLAYRNQLNSNVLFTERINYLNPDYLQENHGGMNEQTAQVDYVQLIKGVSMEAGLKWISRHNESDFTQSIVGKGLIPDLSNDYFNDQQVWSAYNTYQFKIKNYGLKVGLRLEATHIDANFISIAAKVKQNYINLVPNVSASRKVSDLASLNFGFSQRIKRPGINKLNPFVDRSNPSFEVTGNPELKPSVINALQFGYNSNAKLAINLSVGHFWVKTLVIDVTSFDPATQITRNTFANTGDARAYEVNFNVRYPFTKAWNGSVNFNSTYSLVEANDQGQMLERDWFIYDMSVNSGYSFEKGWRLTAALNVISRKIVSLQATSNALVGTLFGVNKDIMKDKLSFSATISNPFNKFRNNIVDTNAINFNQTSLMRDYFRGYNISLNYRFGKLKEAVKKSQRGIKNDDLSN